MDRGTIPTLMGLGNVTVQGNLGKMRNWGIDTSVDSVSYTHLDVYKRQAHEIGHVHQGAINWASTTESSNNLFSNYTIYKFGQNCSRANTFRMPGEISALAIIVSQ